MTEVVAVIPARGGSKGLPGKNLRRVGGWPLVARAVRAARKARHVSRVFVSTDDEAIAEAAAKEGAETIWRPQDLSSDAASSESALLHALDHLRDDQGYTPDVIVFIQCTSPFLTAADIDGTVAPVLAGSADSVFAAAPFHHFVWRRDGESRPVGVNHSGLRQRRQDREPEFLEAGSVYAMLVDRFRAEGNRFCGRQDMYVVDARHVLEIDDEGDLRRAQALAPLLDAERQAAALPACLSAIVFDFDGVFTDNGVSLDEHGKEAVRCDRGDGLGIDLLHDRGIRMLVLSKERNPVVTQRCKKLRLAVLQAVDDKRTALLEWLDANGLDAKGLIYVGNDINDLQCLAIAGCAAGPRDSHRNVMPALNLVLEAAGGCGAVRELADMVCDALDAGLMTVAETEVS